MNLAVAMDRHVTEVIRYAPSHTTTADPRRRQGIVSSRLDYANALLHSTSTNNPNTLQVAHRTHARTSSVNILGQDICMKN